MAAERHVSVAYPWYFVAFLTSTSRASIVATHASSPAMLTYNGGVLVSTFGGEGNSNDFWAGIKNTLAVEGINITFAPAFIGFRDPNQTGKLLSSFPSIDGFFNWWSWYVCSITTYPCKPTSNDFRRPDDVDATLTTDVDTAYKNAAQSRGGPYIMCACSLTVSESTSHLNYNYSLP
jgi:glucan endo-1,3-alpha-glucosidase